jgi:hypothetical protein
MSAEDYKPCLCFIQQGTLTMVCQRERHHVGKHHWASPGARCDWPYSQEDCDSVIGSLHQTTEALAASEAARQQLLDTLTAARDLLVGCQKQAGYLPQQGGYATALTEAEMTLARGIASLDDILTGASR